MIDGARIARRACSPAHSTRRADPRPVVATLGFYLGYGFQRYAIMDGYDQAEEDALLERSPGRRMATASSRSARSTNPPVFQAHRREQRPLPAQAMWAELGGVDEAFDEPGGGLVNLDTLEPRLRAARHRAR